MAINRVWNDGGTLGVEQSKQSIVTLRSQNIIFDWILLLLPPLRSHSFAIEPLSSFFIFSMLILLLLLLFSYASSLTHSITHTSSIQILHLFLFKNMELYINYLALTQLDCP